MRRSLATTLALVPWLASPAIAATFVVDSTADAVDATPGDGLCASVLAGSPCTLRAAVQEANALPGEDLVLLPAGAFALALPGAQEEDAATGDLD
ncbi:MAG: CSLREA domain-containing protein, partial [Acidobacteria bacterium]|nr:CSLREA domain-containing protein [Acidobacteriota bacterium]